MKIKTLNETFESDFIKLHRDDGHITIRFSKNKISIAKYIDDNNFSIHPGIEIDFDTFSVDINNNLESIKRYLQFKNKIDIDGNDRIEPENFLR